MEKTLFHERFERFVKSAFERAPDVTVEGVQEPILDFDEAVPVTIKLREYSLQLINGFDNLYQTEVETVGAENIRYETIANDAIRDFEEWLTRNFNLEGEAVTDMETFCHFLSAELIGEFFQEIREAKGAEERRFEGSVTPFRKK